MNLFLKIIAGVALVAAILLTAAMASLDKEGKLEEKTKKSGNRMVKVLGVACVLIFVLSSSFKIIPTGYTGVRTTFGQINAATVQTGFNWRIPFVQSIELVNNKQQDVTFDSDVWSETSERTAIYYTGITVTYQISSEKSAWIYANVSNYKSDLVSSNLVASAVKASSKTLSDTDATNRNLIEPAAMENIQASLDEKYGESTIIVNKVTIESADFEDSYNEAIAEKQQAQLKAEQQAIINQQNIDQANAEAKAALIAAQAEADALLIEAEAEAEANEMLKESLSEEVLKQIYLDKWDGSLPQYVGGDSDSVLIGFESAEDGE